MTEPKEALKPCPFCGGDNVRVFGPYGWYRHYGISHSCRSFYNGAQELAQGFHSEAEAIAAWNTRAEATENATLREKLAVAREALEKVAAHCANTGYGNPIVNERIVDRCEETAKLALREINALTGGDNAEG